MASSVTDDDPAADMEAAVGAFNEARPRLFGIAYRMLGSVAEAEDIVQEALLRWPHTDRREPVDPARHRLLLEAFVAAAQEGDLERLEAVLSADVVSISDGAGIAPRAARRPVAGRSNVARFIAGFTDWWADTTLTWLETNGQASVLVRRGQTPLAVLSVATSESGIDQLLWVMAPDKLAQTTP